MTSDVEVGSTRRRPWVAGVLSAFLPGAGQMYAGAVTRGAWFFAVDIILVGVGYIGLQNRLELIKAWVRPSGLAAFMAANVVVLGYRAWTAYDATQIARGNRKASTRGASLVLAGSVAALVLVPHAVFGYYDLVQFNFITTTFETEDVAAPTTTTSPAPEEATAAPRATADEAGTPSTTAAPVVAGPALWDGLERLNLLLVGGDAGPDRRAIRTDTMIVASIDPVTGDTALFGIPRNWARIPLPEGLGAWDCNCFPRLINDLYYAGEFEVPDAFPGPGSPGENAMKGGISELLGIPIHYYALVSLNGFIGIIDALGGVEIDVQFRILDETYPHEDGVTLEYVDIMPGVQELDGHLALAYVRIRRHANDYARMSRQRCVLEALLEQSDPTELVLAYPRILGVLKDSLQTDIPVSRLDDFIDLLPIIDTDNIVTLRFIPPDYLAGFTDAGANLPDVELIQSAVRIVMDSSPAEAMAALGLQTLDDACD